MFKIKIEQFHYYHMVTPSPWPFYCALSVFHVVLGMVCLFHGYQSFGEICFGFGIFSTLSILAFWWWDVVQESMLGMHTPVVQRGLYMGFKLFILSEVMFFAGFFWAYFYFALHPIDGLWPPYGIELFDPYKIPLLNTIILIFSSILASIAHGGTVYYSGIKNPKTYFYNFTIFMLCYKNVLKNINNKNATFFEVFKIFLNKLCENFLHFTIVLLLLFTFELGFVFLNGQWIEYSTAPFDPYTTTYGSCFFLLTGFHGLHVFIGATFIAVCCLRWIFGLIHKNVLHHVGYTCAAWYWHFVDVVWLFLYYFLYVTPYLNVLMRRW